MAKRKLTNKQLSEKECLEWFAPSLFEQQGKKPSEEEYREFLNWSEKGIPVSEDNYYNYCKRWRGIHCDTSRDKQTGKIINESMYEEGVRTGDMPYVVILDGMPMAVVDYMKKSLFGGTHSEIIEKVYNLINA